VERLERLVQVERDLVQYQLLPIIEYLLLTEQQMRL
jgi:hypothetical protein